jgi:hypothetical protein
MSSLFWVSYVVLFVVVAVQSVLLYLLLREIGKIYLSESTSFIRDGVPTGKQLPDLSVTTAGGRERLADLVGAAPYAFVLVAQPDCSYCRDAAAALRRWAGGSAKLTSVTLVDGDDVTPYERISARAVARLAPHDMHRRLRVRATPYVFLVDRSRRVLAKGLVNDERDVRDLIERSAGDAFSDLAPDGHGHERPATEARLASLLHRVPGRASRVEG